MQEREHLDKEILYSTASKSHGALISLLPHLLEYKRDMHASDCGALFGY